MRYLNNSTSKNSLSWLKMLYFTTCIVCLFYFGAKLWAGDPGGELTYADTIEGLKHSIDFTWTLFAAFLVFSMQAGFALLGGFLPSKSMLSYLAHVFSDSSIGALVFYIWGFGLMFGGSYLMPGLESGDWFVGFSGFCLAGNSYDVSTIMLFAFQVVFATKAVAIIAGGVAGRMAWKPYLIYSTFLVGVLYPIYGHWVWGDGWLANIGIGYGGAGVLDFAGSSVVHMVGGLMALILAYAVGPRKGKFGPDGRPNVLRGHNLALVVAGTLILTFGWFGFNAGSTLGATDLRIAVIAVNTMVAAAAGGAIILFISYFKFKVVDVGLACNGALGGLVAVTAPCAYVETWAAAVIGLLAGVTMWGSLWFVERKLKIDDPLGASSVHGACGIWGMLSLGVFADGTYGGVMGCIDGSAWQLLAQWIGVIMCMVWVFGVGSLFVYILKHYMPLRVPEVVEDEGIDVHLHGTSCYPEATTTTAT